jgi:hypothetical protein
MKTIKLLENAYLRLEEISKKDGNAAIARRDLYLAIDRINRKLPENCIGSELCGIDGECFTQASGQGYCSNLSCS